MYGNGIKINIGNETGGIIVNSNADLLYTDLIDIRKKGIFTAISQSSYLYFFFLLLSIDMRFVVIFRFWVQIVSLRIVHFFIVFVFSLIHIFSHLIFAILLFWVVQHFLPSFLFSLLNKFIGFHQELLLIVFFNGESLLKQDQIVIKVFYVNILKRVVMQRLLIQLLVFLFFNNIHIST